MPVETTVEVVCPGCGGQNVECRGVVVACRPCEGSRGRSQRRYQRLLERKLFCQDCEAEFATAERLDD
jgi:hypothetical protein